MGGDGGVWNLVKFVIAKSFSERGFVRFKKIKTPQNPIYEFSYARIVNDIIRFVNISTKVVDVDTQVDMKMT